MSKMYGVVTVFFMVDVPVGLDINPSRSKRVRIASQPCVADNAALVIEQFKELNPSIARDIVGEFVYRQYL